jgi:fibronectin-binding autotransporter adhesin
MLIACGAACNAVLLSFLAPHAQAQSSFTWTSTTSGNWSNGMNWLGGSGPTTGVDSSGDVSLEFNAAGSYTSNNDLGEYGVFNMSFDATNGTTNLTGGQLDLSNPASEPNNPTFTNVSTNPVTINNNTTFVATDAQGDGTLEQFELAPGSTTTFNGTMTLEGGAGLQMRTTNYGPGGLGGPGGTMIWTQPVTFTNNPAGLGGGGYFPFRIYEGTLEMGGYTIDNGTSDAPVTNVDGVNEIGTGGVNNGAQTDVYLGPEDRYTTYNPPSGVLLHPNDVVAFYLIAGGESMNQPIQFGDAGSITIGGVNTSGTVYFNDFFKSLPTDGNGIVNGVSQTIYLSAAAGGTVQQNFTMVRGGGSGYDGAGVDKIGPGTWIVAGGGDNNTGEQAYYGNTTVRDGTFELEYDDTGTNNVTLPAAAITAGAPYYASGANGGSLGYNAPSNAVQLGDSGTLPTDNIAFLTLMNPGAPGPRQVLHNISVNNDNPSGSTTIGVGDNGVGNYSGNISLSESVVLTGGTGGLANFSGNVTGTGAITVNGTGTVNLSGTNSYNGMTNVNSGGTLVIAATGALPSGSAIANNGGVTISATTVATSVSGTGVTTVSNGVTFTTNGFTQGGLVDNGLAQVYGNGTTGPISGTGTLTIGNGSIANTLHLAQNIIPSSIGSLSILGNSALDIANNKVIIDYTTGNDPISTIQQWIKNGFMNGDNPGAGPEIISRDIATADAASGLSYGIGYADGADGVVAGLPSGEIEIMFTLVGDANLDGTVNAEDYTPFSHNIGSSGMSWDDGDFNYDGTVNSEDYTPFSHNIGQSASLASQAGALEAANGISVANVPEPASVGMVIMAGLGILRRRRRT